jgi:hypothetical protein
MNRLSLSGPSARNLATVPAAILSFTEGSRGEFLELRKTKKQDNISISFVFRII